MSIFFPTTHGLAWDFSNHVFQGVAHPNAIEQQSAKVAASHGCSLECFQSNAEHALIDRIHGARAAGVGFIVINPGAFTHYAWSIHDALATFAGPVVEVHISNPNAREAWRHTSVVAPVATGSIMGFGMHGYELAVEAIASS